MIFFSFIFYEENWNSQTEPNFYSRLESVSGDFTLLIIIEREDFFESETKRTPTRRLVGEQK